MELLWLCLEKWYEIGWLNPKNENNFVLNSRLFLKTWLCWAAVPYIPHHHCNNVSVRKKVFCMILILFLKVDVVTLSGEVPVSVCTHKLSQNEEHMLVMMENVERLSAFLSFSQDVSTSLFISCSSVFFASFLMGIPAFLTFKNVFKTFTLHLQSYSTR